MPPGAYLEVVGRLEGSKGGIGGIAWHPDGKRAVSYSGRAGEVRMWNTESGETLWTARTGASSLGLGAATFSADGKLIAIGDCQGSLHLIDEDGNLKGSWESHDSGITAVSFSPDGAWLAAVSAKEELAKVWEVATRKAVPTRDDAPDAHAVTFTADGLFLLTGGTFMTRRVEVDSKGVKGFGAIGSGGGDAAVHSVAATPDGSLAAYGQGNGTITIRRRTGPPEYGTLSYFSVHNWTTERVHQGPVTSLAFTADGRYLISGGLPDARLRPELAYSSLVVWDVATRKPVYEERSASPIFERIALSPDGRTLLTAGGDGDFHIRRWRLPQSLQPEVAENPQAAILGDWTETNDPQRGPVHTLRLLESGEFHEAGPMVVAIEGGPKQWVTKDLDGDGKDDIVPYASSGSWEIKNGELHTETTTSNVLDFKNERPGNPMS
jgi:WD40 repeat protein